jgi:hypothetical protein
LRNVTTQYFISNLHFVRDWSGTTKNGTGTPTFCSRVPAHEYAVTVREGSILGTLIVPGRVGGLLARDPVVQGRTKKIETSSQLASEQEFGWCDTGCSVWRVSIVEEKSLHATMQGLV